MTKRELVRAIAEEMDLPAAKIRDIFQKVLDGIAETILQEGRIELRNFGVFQVKERKPRKGRNPRTGVALEVPGKFVVTFKPGRELEERVRQFERRDGAVLVQAKVGAGVGDS